MKIYFLFELFDKIMDFLSKINDFNNFKSFYKTEDIFLWRVIFYYLYSKFSNYSTIQTTLLMTNSFYFDLKLDLKKKNIFVVLKVI